MSPIQTRQVQTVDTWKLLIGLVLVLVMAGVAVIVWAVFPYHRNRRSGPPSGKPIRRGRQYDNEGYDPRGYDRDGYDRLGYDARGYDRNGYDWQGYNAKGYNAAGYDRFGYDIQGYDENGYDRRGYNVYGRDLYGQYNRLYDVADFADSLYSSEGFLSPQRYPVGVTYHAKQRIQERMQGRAGGDVQALAVKAYSFGRSARQLKRTSARMVQELQEQHENGVVLIYRGYVYIFSSDNQLITVYRNERIPL